MLPVRAMDQPAGTFRRRIRADGAFTAIRHAGAEASRQRSAHIAQLILDGLRHQPR